MIFTDKNISPKDITPRGVFEARREVIKAAAAGSFGLALAPWFSRDAFGANAQSLSAIPNSSYGKNTDSTPYKSVTTYNNFYEFGTDKSDPST